MGKFIDFVAYGLMGFGVGNLMYGITHMGDGVQAPPAKIFVQTVEPEKPSMFKFKQTKDAITNTIQVIGSEVNPHYKAEAVLNLVNPTDTSEKDVFRNLFTLAATKHLTDLQKTHNFTYAIEFEDEFNQPQYFPLTTASIHAKYFDQGGEIAWTFRVVFEPGVEPSYFQDYREPTSKAE